MLQVWFPVYSVCWVLLQIQRRLWCSESFQILKKIYVLKQETEECTGKGYWIEEQWPGELPLSRGEAFIKLDNVSGPTRARTICSLVPLVPPGSCFTARTWWVGGFTITTSMSSSRSKFNPLSTERAFFKSKIGRFEEHSATWWDDLFLSCSTHFFQTSNLQHTEKEHDSQGHKYSAHIVNSSLAQVYTW